jgi:acetyltransferase
MLSSIKAYPLLSGFRGTKGVDQEKLTEVIERVSLLVTDLPAIQEMDLNPIIAYEDTICVVDARISI